MEVAAWRCWGVFAAMVIAIFIPAFNTTSVINAMLPIRSDLHLNASTMQWIINAYMLALIALVMISGLLGDRFGQRHMFYTGCLLFMIGLILSALAIDADMLLFGRVLQGAGGSVLLPGTLVIMKRYFPPEKQGMLNAGWAAGLGCGFAFGPVVSGLILESLSWRWLFWITLVILFVSNLLLLVSSKHKEVPNPTVQFDYIGLCVFILGVVPFTFAIVNSTTWGWQSPITITLSVVGLLFLILTPFVEKWIKKKPPLIKFSYYKLPVFTLACVGMLINGVGLIGIYFFMTIYLQNPVLVGFSNLEAGIALLPCGLGLLVGSLVAPLIRRRIGPWHESFLTFVLLIIGFVWLVWQSAHTPFFLLWIPFILCGFACGLANASFPRMALEVIAVEESSRASSLVNSHMYVGVIFGIAFGALLSLKMGTAKLITDLHKIVMPMIDKITIQHALLGHSAVIKTILQKYPRQIRQHIYDAVEQASWDGLRSALALILLLTVIGLVFIVCLYIVKGRKGDSNNVTST